MLKSTRARQLILAPDAGGAAVLVERCSKGDAHASHALQHLLEHLVEQESQSQPQAADGAPRTCERGSTELGECC
eukprot:5239154-Amphidinium_carterae.1